MSEERDAQLQALFAEADVTLQDTEFTGGVMRRVRQRRLGWLVAAAALGVALLLVASQFLQPLQTVSVTVAQVLGIELVDLGDNPAAWFLAPINNLATLVVVLARGLRMSWKRVRRATYVS